MMTINFYAVIGAALVNMIVGFIWYNPKVFGTAWMKEANLKQESMKSANMIKIFGFSLLFSLMLALTMMPLVIHQMHLGSIIANFSQGTDVVAKQAAEADVAMIMSKYGSEFRTFKHGAFHGFMFSLFLILPVFGTNALFELKSWKYIFIHVGNWAISFMLMGGIISYFK